MTTIQATGRRKTATAKILLSQGKGIITINKQPLKQYFPSQIAQQYITAPLQLLDQQKKYNITIRVLGGGTTGQQGAIRLGISRALIIENPNNRPTLRQEKMLTRDSRRVQRKKPGYRKARKQEPFRKR